MNLAAREREKEQKRPVKKRRDSNGDKKPRENVQSAMAAIPEERNQRPVRNQKGDAVDVLRTMVDDDGFVWRHTNMTYERRDTPGLGELYRLKRVKINFFDGYELIVKC